MYITTPYVMQIKETFLTHDDFLNFISYVPKIEAFTGEYKWRTPMTAEEFQLLFKLMFYCALKPEEAFKLKKESFDMEKNILKVKTTAAKPTETTIPPIILGDVKKHLRDKKDADFIFVSKRNGRPLERATPWNYAKEAGKLANLNIFQVKETIEIKGMSLLLLRESYKQFMLSKEAPPGLIDLKFRNSSDNRYGNNTLHDLKSFERKIFRTKFSDDEIHEYVSWYLSERQTYEKLAKEVHRILEGVLKQRKINVADIQSRAKDPEKFQKKLQYGVSFDPKNMQDLAGIRVICFVKSDIEKVRDAIENTFDEISKEGVDPKKADFSGYSDVKYVCKLPRARISPAEELRLFENRRFEIQVRTILQHAWAEIEHDDVYKNPDRISDDLRRRFFLVSNVLETADNELDNLHHTIKT